MRNNFDVSTAISIVEREHEWRKWVKEIPYIRWPEEWEVRAIPPFGGALIRYNVKYYGIVISVYLDAYDELGCMDKKPYWEIHPSENGDCERYWMHETDKLIDGLWRSFNENKPNDEI